MSFDVKNKIKLSGYYDKSQIGKHGMIGGPTEKMDATHQKQSFVKKIFKV